MSTGPGIFPVGVPGLFFKVFRMEGSRFELFKTYSRRDKRVFRVFSLKYSGWRAAALNFLKRTAEEIKTGTTDMTRKQKLRYIWEYYWLPIVGITAGIIFLIYFLYHLLFATKEYWFYVTFVNIRPQTGVESELMEEFVSERGYDLSKKNVFFNDACYFDATSYSGTNNNYYQMFVATVEAGHLDAVVMEEENRQAILTPW